MQRRTKIILAVIAAMFLTVAVAFPDTEFRHALVVAFHALVVAFLIYAAASLACDAYLDRKRHR